MSLHKRGLHEDGTQVTDPAVFEQVFNSSFIGVDIFNPPFQGGNVPHFQQIPSSMMGANEFSFQDTLVLDIDEAWSRTLQKLDYQGR